MNSEAKFVVKDRAFWVTKLETTASETACTFKVFENIFVQPILKDAKLVKPILLPKGDVWVVAFLRNARTIQTLVSHFVEYIRAACGLSTDFRIVPKGLQINVEGVLAQFAPLFSLFTQYSESKQAFLKLLVVRRKSSKELDAFIKQCESEPAWPVGKTINDVIESPLDQISVYRDVTNKLISLSKSASEHGFDKGGDSTLIELDTATALESAAAILERTQKILNEASASHINNLLLNEIEEQWDTRGVDFEIKKSGRKVLKQGKLVKLSRKRDVEYQFVLFSDYLMYGSSTLLPMGKKRFKLHNILALNRMRVGVLSDELVNSQLAIAQESNPQISLGAAALCTLASLSLERKNSLTFNIYMEGDKSFTVKALTGDDLCEWWLAISKANASAKESSCCSNSFTSPVWQRDSAVATCSNCQAPFSATFRRHHCRVCGLVFCSNCSRFRVTLPVHVFGRRNTFGIFGQAKQFLASSKGKDVKLKSVRVCEPCSKTDVEVESAVISLPSMKSLAKRESMHQSSRQVRFDSLADESDELLALRRKSLDKRTRVVLELFDTERTFLEGMTTLRDVFASPLLEDFRSGALDRGGDIIKVVHGGDLSSMLVFMTDIGYIVTLSEQLLQDLKIRLENWEECNECVGDVFLQTSPLFQLYDEYSSSFEFATKTIRSMSERDSLFAKFLEVQCTDNQEKLSRVGAQSIQSLLILPIQRLPRYILLLRELLKLTEPSHSDYELINQAVQAVQAMTAHINEMIRAREGIVKLYELELRWGNVLTRDIDPNEGRAFLFGGELIKQSRKSFDVYEFLLLSDILLYGEGDEHTGRVKHHRTLKIEYCKVAPVLDNDDSTGDFRSSLPLEVSQLCAFDIIGREKSFRVFAKSLNERNTWVEKITQAIAYRKAYLGSKSKAPETLAGNALAQGQMIIQSDQPDQAPIWVHDGPQCLRCDAPFNLIRRRHHCRACGILVCHECSPKRILLKHLNETAPQRVCADCFSRLFISSRKQSGLAVPVPAPVSAHEKEGPKSVMSEYTESSNGIQEETKQNG